MTHLIHHLPQVLHIRLCLLSRVLGLSAEILELTVDVVGELIQLCVTSQLLWTLLLAVDYALIGGFLLFDLHSQL